MSPVLYLRPGPHRAQWLVVQFAGWEGWFAGLAQDNGTGGVGAWAWHCLREPIESVLAWLANVRMLREEARKFAVYCRNHAQVEIVGEERIGGTLELPLRPYIRRERGHFSLNTTGPAWQARLERMLNAICDTDEENRLIGAPIEIAYEPDLPAWAEGSPLEWTDANHIWWEEIERIDPGWMARELRGSWMDDLERFDMPRIFRPAIGFRRAIRWNNHDNR